MTDLPDQSGRSGGDREGRPSRPGDDPDSRWTVRSETPDGDDADADEDD